MYNTAGKTVQYTATRVLLTDTEVLRPAQEGGGGGGGAVSGGAVLSTNSQGQSRCGRSVVLERASTLSRACLTQQCSEWH